MERAVTAVTNNALHLRDDQLGLPASGMLTTRNRFCAETGDRLVELFWEVSRVERRRLKIVKLLLERGHVNLQHNDGRTALSRRLRLATPKSSSFSSRKRA